MYLDSGFRKRLINWFEEKARVSVVSHLFMSIISIDGTEVIFYIYYWRERIGRLRVCRTLTAILRIRKRARQPVCREVKLCREINLQAALNKLLSENLFQSYEIEKYFLRKKYFSEIAHLWRDILFKPNQSRVKVLNSCRDPNFLNFFNLHLFHPSRNRFLIGKKITLAHACFQGEADVRRETTNDREGDRQKLSVGAAREQTAEAG